MFMIENPPVLCFPHIMVRKQKTRRGKAAAIGAVLAIGLASAAHAASCDIGKAPPVPVVKGLPYADARQAVLAGGWQVVTGHPHNDLSSNESTFREQGFAELQFCRITADSLCRFKFSAGNVVLWLTTSGDENLALQTKATVKAAKLACADEGDPG